MEKPRAVEKDVHGALAHQRSMPGRATLRTSVGTALRSRTARPETGAIRTRGTRAAARTGTEARTTRTRVRTGAWARAEAGTVRLGWTRRHRTRRSGWTGTRASDQKAAVFDDRETAAVVPPIAAVPMAVAIVMTNVITGERVGDAPQDVSEEVFGSVGARGRKSERSGGEEKDGSACNHVGFFED